MSKPAKFHRETCVHEDQDTVDDGSCQHRGVNAEPPVGAATASVGVLLLVRLLLQEAQ